MTTKLSNLHDFLKEGENADNLGPNGLVVSARKCAASMAAENCTSCRK